MAHYDRLGRLVEVGDIIAVPTSDDFVFGVIYSIRDWGNVRIKYVRPYVDVNEEGQLEFGYKIRWLYDDPKHCLIVDLNKRDATPDKFRQLTYMAVEEAQKRVLNGTI